MIKIPLPHGKFALIDDDDFENISQYKWYALKSRNTFYAYRQKWMNGKTISTIMHRMILNAPNGYEVDHINFNGLDNRKCNLRIASRSQNQANRPKTWDGTSKYKGVHWHKLNKRWIVQITIEGKNINCGAYKDEIEAAIAYDRAAIQYFGEFAYLNFSILPLGRKPSRGKFESEGRI